MVRYAVNGYTCKRSSRRTPAHRRRETQACTPGVSMHGGNRSDTGTRFRLFPRPPFIHPERPPETVYVATPPGWIGPGPSDDRLYLIDPIGKRRPYGINPGPYGTPHLDLPPWRGPIRRPVQPDAEGHFDHLPIGPPAFAQAHAFVTIGLVLDLCERHVGRPFP